MGLLTLKRITVLKLYSIFILHEILEASFYLEILCKLTNIELKEMKIHQHIISERGSKIVAFKLISLIIPYKKNFLEVFI